MKKPAKNAGFERCAQRGVLLLKRASSEKVHPLHD
jgi:hypothetical protein